MTPAWAWPLLILGVAGWAAAAVLATVLVLGKLRRSSTDQAYPTLPSTNEKPPAPAATVRMGAPAPGPEPVVPNVVEHDLLERIRRARIAAAPMAVDNSRIIADGLRIRFPDVPDATLGLVILGLVGYLNAAWIASPTPEWALRVISDSFGLGAEELTRIARQEGAPR